MKLLFNSVKYKIACDYFTENKFSPDFAESILLLLKSNDKPPKEIENLLQILRNEPKWKEANIYFNKFRILTLTNNSTPSLKNYFLLFENIYKAIFNFTKLPFPYDKSLPWILLNL